MPPYRSINAAGVGAVWIFGFDSVIERVNSVLIKFTDLELNGMSSSDIPDVPPPLPLKGSMADYGNLMESQDLISPTTSPPAHQRVSPREDDHFLQFSLLLHLDLSPGRRSLATSWVCQHIRRFLQLQTSVRSVNSITDGD